MSERKQDRDFQLEILKAQLKHETLVAIYTAGISTGISFIVMALPLGALLLSVGVTGGIWWLMIWAYLIVGSVLTFSFLIRLGLLKRLEREDIEGIGKKFSDCW